MKKVLTSIVGATFIASSAWAVPTLQLDIAGGNHIPGDDETVYSTSDQFTLYALLNPTVNNHNPAPGTPNFGGTFYISAAIVGTGGPGFGSFSIGSTTFSQNSGMQFGTPPVDIVPDNKDLPSHDVFPAWYAEVAFSFDTAHRAQSYDVQVNPGGLVTGSGPLYYHGFNVDVSGLSDGYAVHFDLYNIIGDKVGDFAPFSHDAQSGGRNVPDGGMTLALLGTGLLGIDALRRRLWK